MKLTAAGSRLRQQRLAAILADRGLDAAIISRRENVYYFSGFLCPRHHAAAVLVRADGHSTLVASDGSEELGVDDVQVYEAAAYCTMNSVQHERVAALLGPVAKAGRYGADLAGGSAILAAQGGTGVVDLTQDVYRLRKCKDSDELDAIRHAIRLTHVMYETTKKLIRPGLDEVDLFAELQAAATREAGELLDDLGNDFRANAGGGKARRRAMNAGELYVLDAGPGLHGYYADNCRTFAVDKSPTDAQMKAWSRIDSLFPILEAAIKPGMKATALFDVADDYFKWEGYDGMAHHLGHGIGLCPHETPELNPKYDAVIEVGDVFTMEPGLYSETLRAGIRIEENYVVTEDGVERLTSFPRALV